jgi:hypothetical protein
MPGSTVCGKADPNRDDVCGAIQRAPELTIALKGDRDSDSLQSVDPQEQEFRSG